ncbi:hypothetical protein lerEdw1_006008 [Lerista edwardsae]|nr:hypothetical protein lerEdw1_006008 [Lerista edwardsae]
MQSGLFLSLGGSFCVRSQEPLSKEAAKSGDETSQPSAVAPGREEELQWVSSRGGRARLPPEVTKTGWPHAKLPNRTSSEAGPAACNAPRVPGIAAFEQRVLSERNRLVLCPRLPFPGRADQLRRGILQHETE